MNRSRTVLFARALARCGALCFKGAEMATLKHVTAVIASMGLAMTGATPASAQAECDSRAKIIRALDRDYKEAPVGIGLTQSGRVVELLVSRRGSWTLLATAPSGLSCLIAAGENWETMTLPVGDKS